MARRSAKVLTYEPPAGRGENAARVVHTRQRERLLEGGWESDAQVRIKARLGSIRAKALGYPDLSANPFRATASQSATLYDRAPLISHPDDTSGQAAAYLSAALREVGAWSLMARVQRQVIGLREMLVRVDVSEAGKLLLRPVSPSVVEAEPDADEGDRPAQLYEIRRRNIDNRWQWTRDFLDPASELYRVETMTGDDVSAEALGASGSGESYPWRLANGDPLMPYATYHAAKTGRLWDPWEAIELVEGTYEISCLWSFWGHCVRDASWPQRWAMGVTVGGARTMGTPQDAVQVVESDPAVVLMLVPLSEMSGTAQVGQWTPGCDPDKLATSILTYESRLPQYAGLNPADFTRTSGDPRSAYALSLSRDGQREANRRFEPTQADGDGQLLTLCAAGLNRWSEDSDDALNLPETGWVIRYPGIPESREEREARRNDIFERLDRKLITRVKALAELEGIDPAEARRLLAEVDRDAENVIDAEDVDPPDDEGDDDNAGDTDG